MASYHFYAQIIGRGDRRSAVAAAAYRSASRIVDRATGQVHDYTRKRGVVHSEILLPQGTPTWLADRTKLWNHVQAVEKRKDAQYAREINLALPHELTRDQRLDLLRSFAETEFVAKGMIADIALHEPVLDRGEDARNCHAHIMLTLRQGTRDGLSLTKTRSWNAKSELKSWRAVWAEHQNRMLADHHHNGRVDHRSLADQHAEALVERDIPRARMLDRVPEIHVGPAAMEMAKAGRRPRALQPMPLSPPPMATLVQPPTRAMPPPTPSIGRQVHRAETRSLTQPVIIRRPPAPVLRPQRQPPPISRRLKPPTTQHDRKPFVTDTWRFAIVRYSRPSRPQARPLFRLTFRETKPRRSWLAKVSPRERLTRLEFNLTRIERNRVKATSWVRHVSARQARMLRRWRKWHATMRWLIARSDDPDQIRRLLKRLKADRRMALALMAAVQQAKAEEARLHRRCFEVRLKLERVHHQQRQQERRRDRQRSRSQQ